VITRDGLLKIIENALCEPPSGDLGLCDFSPDRASEKTLAKAVLDAFEQNGLAVWAVVK
jgi:hypothetical protein